jgi:formylglycine-generating enzyme required for sulfatase activity
VETWRADREAQFARWRTGQPDLDSKIDGFKARAAELVAEAGGAPSPVGAPPKIWRVTDAPAEIWDAPYAPRMTLIPAGEFDMGAEGNPHISDAGVSETTPVRRVTIAYPFAVGRYALTVGEFAAFAADTGFKGSPCLRWVGYDNPDIARLGWSHAWLEDPKSTWETPGFEQTYDHPVVCVSWDDAKAYVAWLTAKTGHTYRLLSEAEWEYATRAGTTTKAYWGDSLSRDNGNFGADTCCWSCREGRDQWDITAPGGQFEPNPFGLYDMIGNAWEWLEDGVHYDYKGAPADGSAWVEGDCARRMIRGSSWYEPPSSMNSDFRYHFEPEHRSWPLGFRVAREL